MKLFYYKNSLELKAIIAYAKWQGVDWYDLQFMNKDEMLSKYKSKSILLINNNMILAKGYYQIVDYIKYYKLERNGK